MKSLLAILAATLMLAACSPPADEQDIGSALPVSPREAFRAGSGRILAVLSDKTLYLSAVGPSDAQASITDQTKSAMDQLGETLRMASLDYAQVVSCHVHLADMENYADMNATYGSYFPEGGYPARTTLELPGLPGGAGVLLMCVAYADPSEIEVVRPPADEIPPAMGPYSPAVRAGRTLYLSGQGGRNPATGELADSAEEQAQQTLRTIGTILGAAGLTYDNTVLASSYLPPSTEEPTVDGAFETIFSPGGAPSRASVALSRLPGDIAVEITFVAVDDNYVNRLFMHDQAPTAVSSPASLSGGVVYTSAMPGRGETFREQVLDALQTQATALQLASMDLPHIVRMTAYLSDLASLDELTELLSESFPETPPALTVVQTRNPSHSQVILETIAVQ